MVSPKHLNVNRGALHLALRRTTRWDIILWIGLGQDFGNIKLRK